MGSRAQLRQERDELIRPKVNSGMLHIVDIAKSLREHPLYQGICFEAVCMDVRRFFRQKRITSVPKNCTHGHAALEKLQDRNAGQESSVVKTKKNFGHAGPASFENLISPVSLNLPIGVHREVDKLLAVLRPAWVELERQLSEARGKNAAYLEEAERTKEITTKLQADIDALSGHTCPDADGTLKEENSRLNSLVEKLRRRIAFLEDNGGRVLPHRPLDGNHLAVPAGRE